MIYKSLCWCTADCITRNPLCMQGLHCSFEKIRLQLAYAFAPLEPHFALYQPESVFTPLNLGPFPWSPTQLDNCLSTHTDHVVAYIESLSLDALKICTSTMVVAAATGGEEDGVASPVVPGLVALLTRSSMNLRASVRAMVLDSAETFASSIEAFTRGQGEAVLQQRIPVMVRTQLCRLSTEMLESMECSCVPRCARGQHESLLHLSHPLLYPVSLSVSCLCDRLLISCVALLSLTDLDIAIQWTA
jgi:hypothetical protein